MNKITMYQTLDGQVHETQKKALKHLDLLLNTVIHSHAHKLAGMKYVDVVRYLNENLPAFIRAGEIISDRAIIDETE